MGSGGLNFGSLPGNNAPMPVFGGTNPTGMLPGGFSTKESFGIPQFNMFGAPPTNHSNMPVTPMANLPLYSNNGPGGSNNGGTNIQGMNSGFGSNSGSLTQLQNDYGAGIGQMLYNILNGGLFNQNVANSFINAMQPAYNRGIASTEQAFGAEGARFGSAAALGIGDFASQFTLNEQQTMAQMYMQAQQEQVSLLQSILPTINKEQDNSQSSGWVGDLMGGLEILGGAAAMFVPGLQGAGALMIGSGAGTIAGANSGGGGGGGGSSNPVANIGLPNLLAGTSGSPSGGGQDWWNMYPQSYWQDVSAGSTLGGASSPTGDQAGMVPLM